MNWLTEYPEVVLLVVAISVPIAAWTVRGRRVPLRTYVRGLVDSNSFQQVILLLILAAVLIPGVMTLLDPEQAGVAALALVSRLIVALFTAEITLRLLAHGVRYFRDPWAILDVIAVGVALVPGLGFMVVLRTFRILRVLRLLPAVPEVRKIANLLLHSLRVAASAMSLIVGIVYVEAVVVTELFATAAPQYFGSIGQSVFTLIQLTSGEGWPEIARLVMSHHPWSAIFFVGHVFASLLIILNVIGVLISDTARVLDDEPVTDQDLRIELLLTEIRDLRAAVDRLSGGEGNPTRVPDS